ncbi:MAG: hypothetical protein ABIF77_10410 [bacterium]
MRGSSRFTGQRHRFTLGLLVVMALLASQLVGCGGGDTTDPPSGPDTAAEFSQRGWDRFTAGNYSGAASDFTAALGLDAGYGPALAGRAWTQLAQAASAAAMQTAVTSFNAAVAAGEDGAYVIAGRAAAYLGAGTYASGVTDAQAALTAEPTFVFSYRNSFDRNDLYLIIAFAQAGQGNLGPALLAADAVTDSGIEEISPASWIVNSVTYTTFAGAVLAHLQAVSDAFSG